MEKVGSVLELPTISDPIEALLLLYRGLRSLWNFLEEGQQEVERFNGGRPVCVEKCGACCQRMTPLVSKLEVSYMLGQLHSSKLIREAALSWVKTPAAELKAQGIPYQQALKGEHLATLQADVLRLLGSPCPFLSETKCLVYPARPLTCRAYGVTMTADEWCPRPLTPYESPNGRMLIGKDTPLGLKVRGLTIALWEAIRYLKRADMATPGFLPMLAAEALAPAEVRQLRDEGHIQPAKMGKGQWAAPDLFGKQP